MLLEETNQTKTEQVDFQPTQALSNTEFLLVILIVALVIGLIAIFLLVRMYQLNQRPRLYVTKKNPYKSSSIGRLVECERSALLPSYWRYTTKDLDKAFSVKDKIYKKDYLTFYNKQPYQVMKSRVWEVWNLGVAKWEKYPHYHIDKRPLPPRLWFKKRVLKESRKNLSIYFLFRLFGRSRLIHKYLEYETLNEDVKEIWIIQMDFADDKRDFVFYTEFERKEYFPEENIEAWIKHPELELVSVVEKGKEHFVEKIAEKQAGNLKTKNPFKNLKKKKPLPAPEVVKEPDKELVLNDFKNDPILMSKHESICNKLKEKKEEAERLIRLELMKPEDKNYYYTLYQIEDLNHDSNHRKVVRKGDPIVKIKEINTLDEAIQEQESYDELRAHMEIKLEERNIEFRELETKYHVVRERNRDLELNLELNVEEEIIKAQTERKRKGLSDKINFAYKVIEGKNIGREAKENISSAILNELKNDKDTKTTIEKLERKIKEQDDKISKMSEEEKYNIVIGTENEKKITSLSDVNEYKKELERVEET